LEADYIENYDEVPNDENIIKFLKEISPNYSSGGLSPELKILELEYIDVEDPQMGIGDEV